MPVSRCVCFDRSFEELAAIAGETGGGLLEMHKRTGCGARCGLCIPYLQIMLQTGETDLPVMWSDDFKREGVAPGRLGRLEQRLRDEDADADTRTA